MSSVYACAVGNILGTVRYMTLRDFKKFLLEDVK